jgi:tRNA-2-methylthio-N6-dimethylallyladenosine synthase
MNVNDSEYIIGQLEQLGYLRTKNFFKSDLIILNTCCVRENVEQKIYNFISEIKKVKEKNPNVILCICGCMAQKEKENIFKKAPYVDMIFSPSYMNNLENIINSTPKYRNKKYISSKNPTEFILKHTPISRESKVSAWIQIMRGCNNYCSYCVVPYTRGPEQSRGVSEILSEVENLAQKNYKEIFLLGQNVNSYGKNLPESVTFSKLLTLLNNINGIERIRFMTSHPKDFNFNLIKVIKNSDKICEHIHLPIQSGSNKILKIMNRGYDINQYKSIIQEIRNKINNISITTDILVGFPGETEEDFQQTLNIFKEIEFDNAYTFIYSNRENTIASLMSNQVPLQIKKERLSRLNNLQKEISIKINKKLEDKILEVLVDKKSLKKISNQLSGRTRTNKTVVFVGEEELIGQLVKVKILKSDTWTLYGELVR